MSLNTPDFIPMKKLQFACCPKGCQLKSILQLNNLNLSTNYDLNADGVTSLAWEPLRVSGGTQLFEDKMNVNFGTTLDPYAIDNSGNRINVFNINNGGSLFRMTSANMTLNYSITSKKDDKKEEKKISHEKHSRLVLSN